jgi:hypothetical protein
MKEAEEGPCPDGLSQPLFANEVLQPAEKFSPYASFAKL